MVNKHIEIRQKHTITRVLYGRLLRIAALLAMLVVLISGTLMTSLPGGIGSQPAAAQGNPTPLTISVPTYTPTPFIEITLTPTRTPTLGGGTQYKVEAMERANIRSAPDLNAEVLKEILPGTFFGVIGRRGEWLEIVYPGSISGVAWVYQGVVNITGGDPALIPELDVAAVPSANISTAAAQATANFITGTPGAPGTATALQGSATGAFTLVANNPNPNAGLPLPTFTYPPPFVEATLPARSASTINGSGLPPIVPIIGLGVLGLAGLAISALRRGG